MTAVDDLDAHERLVEWGKSLHREPWNYWPSTSVLGRMKDEGAGASQGSSDSTPDGGLGSLYDRLCDENMDILAKDRRIADVQAAYYQMPMGYRTVVDATYRCASIRDTPRGRIGAIEYSELAVDEYDDRMEAMLAWLTHHLCLPAGRPQGVALARKMA